MLQTWDDIALKENAIFQIAIDKGLNWYFQQKEGLNWYRCQS